MTKINNNYGEITYKIKKQSFIIPFEVTKEMLKKVNGKDYICYSKDVSFQIEKKNDFRNRSTSVAINLNFCTDDFSVPIYVEREIDTDNFWKKIRTKFDDYFVRLPNREDQLNYLENNTDPIVKFQIEQQKMMFDATRGRIQNMYTDDDVLLREYLKYNGFQTRMEGYFISSIFINKDLASSYEIDATDIKLTVEMIVQLDSIDILFREKILGWILGIEDAYKSWISRKLKDPIQVESNSEEELIKNWKTKNKQGEKEVERAIERGIFRESKDGFDYINKTVPIEDLFEELDFSELSELLSQFEKIDKATIDNLDELIKSKKLLDNIRKIRNLAAHGKTFIPDLMDPDYNANFLLDFSKKSSSFKKWMLYSGFKNNFIKQLFSEEISERMVQVVYGNPYRRGWVELNYLYHRFIQKIDPQRFQRYAEEFDALFSKFSTRESLYGLEEISNIQRIEDINSPYNVIYNEALMAKSLGQHDF